MTTKTTPGFEPWLRTVCFQQPTPEAYDLARDAWSEAQRQASRAAPRQSQVVFQVVALISFGISLLALGITIYKVTA